jgi:rhomboid family GlyGly-CTERM serine protease
VVNPILTPAERSALLAAALLLVLHALEHRLGIGDALEYRKALLMTEPWRVVTGHLVHINWPHALVNAAALWVVARLYATDLDARSQGVALIIAALTISAGLALLYPTLAWYRGLSGALHGLFFAGAAKWLLSTRPRELRTLWLPAALFIGGWIKVAAEQPAGVAFADWLGAAVVPQAHLIGAVCGTMTGALLAALQPRQRHQQAEQ